MNTEMQGERTHAVWSQAEGLLEIGLRLLLADSDVLVAAGQDSRKA